MRIAYSFVLALVLATACGGSDGGGSPDADPLAPDADPTASDADPAASDADPTAPDANPNCAPDPMPPGAPACPAECTGGCSNDHVCTIMCGSMQCNDGVITCPPDYACVIICDGLDACDTSVINCPPMYACSVQCPTGNDACGDITLNCGDASCSLACGDEAQGAPCAGAQVVCGSGPCGATCAGPTTPTLDCTASCGCTEC